MKHMNFLIFKDFLKNFYGIFLEFSDFFMNLIQFILNENE